MSDPVTLSQLADSLHAGTVTSSQVTEQLSRARQPSRCAPRNLHLSLRRRRSGRCRLLDAELAAGHDQRGTPRRAYRSQGHYSHR